MYVADDDQRDDVSPLYDADADLTCKLTWNPDSIAKTRLKREEITPE